MAVFVVWLRNTGIVWSKGDVFISGRCVCCLNDITRMYKHCMEEGLLHRNVSVNSCNQCVDLSMSTMWQKCLPSVCVCGSLWCHVAVCRGLVCRCA